MTVCTTTTTINSRMLLLNRMESLPGWNGTLSECEARADMWGAIVNALTDVTDYTFEVSAEVIAEQTLGWMIKQMAGPSFPDAVAHLIATILRVSAKNILHALSDAIINLPVIYYNILDTIR